VFFPIYAILIDRNEIYVIKILNGHYTSLTFIISVIVNINKILVIISNTDKTIYSLQHVERYGINLRIT